MMHPCCKSAYGDASWLHSRLKYLNAALRWLEHAIKGKLESFALLNTDEGKELEVSGGTSL